MPISHLEHFLIQVADLEKTCDWYEQVIGLRRGPTPDFKFPVQWLYAGDKDVLHVTEGGKNVSENRKRYLGQQSEALTGTGVIDHVAFRRGARAGVASMPLRHVTYTGLEPAIYVLLDPRGA